MGQSLAKNYLHIVFSTKHRQKLIHPPIEEELHAYLGGISKNLECIPIKIGGHSDHVHVLCLLSKKITLIKFVEELKSSSSKWLKTKDKSLEKFYWQDGYGAFSVSPSDVETLIKYIENQKEHHREITFQEEYKIFLREYKVEYDERFIWD